MNLRDVLNQMIQENVAAGQPADVKIGTVVSASPLEISINHQMAPLREGVLYLTEAVVEKKIPVLAHAHTTSGLSHTHTTGGLGHSHTLNGTDTSTSLTGSYQSSEGLAADVFTSSTELKNIVCYENGKALPAEGGYIILNRALAVGDKVLLLRVQRGQKFIVLSRGF